jgi:hypothetical protein
MPARISGRKPIGRGNMKLGVVALLLLVGPALSAHRTGQTDTDRWIRGKPFEARFAWTDFRKSGNEAGSSRAGGGAIHRDSMGRLRLEPDGETRPDSATVFDPVAEEFWRLDLRRKRVTQRGRSSDSFLIIEITFGDQTYFCPPPEWTDRDPEDQSIGQRVIEGLTCDGFRREEADRRIEYWVSSDLHQVVSEKITSDFSDCTYTVYDIHRQEPDPLLFVVPAGYTDISDAK